MQSQVERLSGIINLCRSAGWALPHEKICWVSERHNILHHADGLLHCETGPALAYPDGWSLWRIGGVAVDEQIVLRPETQTVSQIEKESNEEVRRVRTERFGWPRYIAETNSQCLDSRRNDVDGTTEALVQLKDGSRRLLCACRSTGRVYAVGVDQKIETCAQAQNWMAGGSSFAGKKFNLIGAS